MVDADRRDRGKSFWTAWLILCPCLSFAILGDAPLVGVLAVVALVPSLVSTRAVTVSLRSIVYTLTTAFLTAVMINTFYPIDPDRFFLPFSAEVTFPFLIALAVMMAYYRHTPTSTTDVLAVAVLSLMIQGGVEDPEFIRLYMANGSVWANRYFVYTLSVALMSAPLIVLILSVRETRGVVTASSGGLRWPRFVVRGGSFALLAVMTFAACMMLLRYDRVVERMFLSVFNRFVSSRHESALIFSDTVDLRRMVGPKTRRSGATVILRAVSERPPGYLRGRAYNTYQSGHWTGMDLKERMTTLSRPGADSDVISSQFKHRTAVTEEGELLTTVEVYPSRRAFNSVLLIPGTYREVELIAETVWTGRDGMSRPSNWDQHGGYTALCAPEAGGVTFADERDAGNSEAMAPYLQIPDDLKFMLKAVAAEAFGDLSTDADALMVCRQAERFLRDTYTYKLGVKVDTKSDPVSQFLTVQRQGHCEFFASSAALLLRTRGIPTRYVTGVVCLESLPAGDNWQARLRDCHAWAEAYLADEGKWVIVEGTPSSGIPHGNKPEASAFNFIYLPALFIKRIYAMARRGYVAKAVVAALSSIGNTIKWLFWTGPWYVGWGCFGLICIWWVRRTRRRRSGRLVLSPIQREQKRILKLIDKALKRVDIIRGPTTSIGDLRTRIDETVLARSTELAEILDEYEAMRYRPEPLSSQAVTEFYRRAHKTLGKLTLA